MIRFQLFILIVVVPLSASAADPWIGQKVFWKSGAVAKVGNKQVDIELVPFPERVGDVNGDWLWVGRAWIRKSDIMLTQQALEYYSDEIRRKPNQANLWNRRGSVWDTKGENDNAIKDYSEAIRIDPKYSMAYNNRGTVWYDKKDYDRAIADYDEAIRLSPMDVMAYTNRGSAWRRKKDYDRAITDYNEAIRLDPKYVRAYHNRGSVWHEKKDYDREIADYSEAIRLDPKNPKVYSDRGLAWKGKKEYDRAIADCNEAIRLDPKSARSYNALAWLMATCVEEKYRNGKKAVVLATTANELGGWKDANNIDTLAASYAEAGDFPSAVKWQEKAVALASSDMRKQLLDNLELYRQQKPCRE